jgi:hypothetical protein
VAFTFVVLDESRKLTCICCTSSYDVDLSGDLSKAELMLLLQDLSELRYGHRNVPREVIPCMITCAIIISHLTPPPLVADATSTV